MNEPYMTMAEIEAKYPNEWVLIDKPTSERDSLTVTGGTVVFHCHDRAEFIRRVFDFPEVRDGAIQYIGRFPDPDDEVIPVEQELAQP
jgi:hypothetical protein